MTKDIILRIITMKKTFMVAGIILLVCLACRNDSELSIERGEYYYNAGQYENAVIEYQNVINEYPTKISCLDSDEIQMLANAHHNISVVYLRRGYESNDKVEKSLFLEKAEQAVRISYDLYPMDTYKKTWDEIIKAK